MDIKVIASGSSGNAYLISDGYTNILLDAGIPFKQLQKTLDFKISSINACFVTHCHKDHSKAVKELMRASINVYASQGTINECGWAGHRIKPMKAFETVHIGSMDTFAFDVEHDAPEPLGFVVKSKVTDEKLLYFTDTYYLKYRFTELNYIMGECNYYYEKIAHDVGNDDFNENLAKRIIQSHMNLEHFLDLLKANDLSKVKQIYLLHLSDNNSDEELFKRKVAELAGAEVYVC